MNASTRRLIRHTHSTPHTLVCAQAEKRRKSARTLTSYQLFMQGEREALKQLPPKEVMLCWDRTVLGTSRSAGCLQHLCVLSATANACSA